MEIFDADYKATIQPRIKRYGLGENLQDARDLLLAPFIRLGAEGGLPRSMVLQILSENGITMFDNHKDPNRAITSASMRIFGKSYEQLTLEAGGNRWFSLTVNSPITRGLFQCMREVKSLQEAAEILGFNDKYGKKEGPDRLSMFCFRISGKYYSDLRDDVWWFAVRQVLMTSSKTRLGPLTIAFELGLCDTNSDQSVKVHFKAFFDRYVPRNFNGMSIKEARNFYSSRLMSELQ